MDSTRQGRGRARRQQGAPGQQQPPGPQRPPWQQQPPGPQRPPGQQRAPGPQRPPGQQRAPNQIRPIQQFERPPQQFQPRPAQLAQLQPAGSRPIGTTTVDQITSGFQSLTAGNSPALIGRGAVRGRQMIETPYYRVERPESSKTDTGKQGSGGQSIALLANYFPITTYTDWTLYQYRVDFNPPQSRINIQRGLLSVHQETLGAYIFDGTMLFSSKKYNPDILELTSKRTSDDQIVLVTVKFTSVIERGDYAYLQVYNILLRKILQNLKLTLVGRNYYDAVAAINIPQHNLQLWPGYETTVGMYDSGLLLRSEISTKVMREETVLDYLKECAEERGRNSDWMTKFKMGIIGSTVLTRYNNQTYRIDDIDDEANTNSTFRKKDGSSISYSQYYFQKYNIKLSSAYQPMLVSKKKKSFRIEGDETELVYLVPELCTLTGITENMRNNYILMSDLANHTRVGPTERVNKCLNFVKRISETPECANLLRQWNLTLSNNLIKIPGRVLIQEVLQGANHTYKSGLEADWTSSLRSLPMFTNAVIKQWVMLTPRLYGAEVRQFVKTLVQVAKGLSFELPFPQLVEMADQNIRTYSTQLDILINQYNPAFILCLIPSPRGDLYNVIKRQLCIDRAVPSQVVLLKHFKKINMSVCTKIAIQINCKLGGAPWRVSIPEKKMMIIGFDVCHDKQNKNKSWGALVATMNDQHTSYFSCVQPHESGQELSSYFKMSIAKALNKYKSINKYLPNSIVIYRDGVGDGQLSYVHRTEVDLINETCREIYGEQKVGLAFIIVKKRISTRFFASAKAGFQNPPPGTVVDSTVTDPTMYDFYLISQNVRHGTVTPTHYNVIMDTLSDTTSVKFTPTLVQKLTFKLTHMYYNWAGTVRVPALCQLAHKLAFLTGQTLKRSPNPGLEDLLYFL